MLDAELGWMSGIDILVLFVSWKENPNPKAPTAHYPLSIYFLKQKKTLRKIMDEEVWKKNAEKAVAAYEQAVEAPGSARAQSFSLWFPRMQLYIDFIGHYVEKQY
ncbi:hypothetical protein EVAR_52308_1 [Eumeta japonica]|uniref:Uncharacterized protein n=1 Tax=Eumeta variegata TaxID=151549 RepID=A0A4C1Y6U4_EUMVA|nr:hypothetical protein EVAR_52308_1 [Eumeta japonica]